MNALPDMPVFICKHCGPKPKAVFNPSQIKIAEKGGTAYCQGCQKKNSKRWKEAASGRKVTSAKWQRGSHSVLFGGSNFAAGLDR